MSSDDVYFFLNDTVVDVQRFEIFGHSLWVSILYVFLSQNLLICSSPAWILLWKFLEETPHTPKMISFNTGVHMNVIFQHFLFFKLHDARWIGNFIKITTKETWSTSDYFILFFFFFILFLCVNESSMEDLLGLCKKQMDDMVNFNFSTHKWETASKFC